MFKGFLAYELAIQLHRRVEGLALKGSLRDQMTRASQSIILNLAEGSGKPSRAEKARFYSIAFGSIREVQAVFDIVGVKDKATLDLIDHVAGCVYKLAYR